MKKTRLLGILFPLLLTSCINELNVEESGEDQSYLKRTFQVTIDNHISQTRSLSAENPDKLIINQEGESLTATSIAFLNDSVGVVSYHGRYGTPYGRVDLFKYQADGFKEITATLDVEARINHLTTDENNRLFVGLDSQAAPYVATIFVEGDKFAEQSAINAMRLGGESVNCVFYRVENGKEYLYTATGGDGKTDIQTTDSVLHFNGSGQKLSVAQMVAYYGYQKNELIGQNNYKSKSWQSGCRGKWISGDEETLAVLHMNSYNNFSHFSMFFFDTYRDGFNRRTISQSGIINFATSTENKNMCLLDKGAEMGSKTLYICGGQNGFQSFKLYDYDAYNFSQDTNKGKTELIDQLNFFAQAVAKEGNTLYIACGDGGVRKVETLHGQLTLGTKFNVSSENGVPSANYVALKGDYLYIAYGTAGVMAIRKDSHLFKQP